MLEAPDPGAKMYSEAHGATEDIREAGPGSQAVGDILRTGVKRRSVGYC